RRSHAAAQSGFDIQQFFAFVRAIGNEVALRQNLENQIACSGDRAPANRSAAGRSPAFLLIHGIPRHEHSTLSFRRNRTDGGRRSTCCLRRGGSWITANNSDITYSCLIREVRIETEGVVSVRCGWDVN